MTFAFTFEQLCLICPELSTSRATEFLPHLNAAAVEASVSTPVRAAAFIAQLAHESAEFQIWREVWGKDGGTPDQKNYERPMLANEELAPLVPTGVGLKIPVWQQLGNTEPGDGYRYRGRGPLQTTGRSEYRNCGKALGLDLLRDPNALAGPIPVPPRDPWPGFAAAAWFWRTRSCNTFADAGDFLGLTKRINGGVNGLQSRQAYWATAKQVLGVEG